MADKNQNKAELYRKERKERLAKAAKKNAKNIEKKTAVRSAVKKVVAIILAVAVALGCLLGILSYSGVTQRAIQIGGVGSEKISYAEYKYYYFKIYNEVYSKAKQQAQQYGSSGGYDVTLTPAEQTTTAQDDDGNEITWVEYFQSQTKKVAQMYLAYYQEALKMGLSLDENELKDIDDQIEELREQADKNGKSSEEDTNKGLSLNAYLRRMYGNGITETFLKNQLQLESLVRKYYQAKIDEFEDAVTPEEIDKVFQENKDLYQFVDIRLYQFKDEDVTDTEGKSEDEITKLKEEASAKTKADAEKMKAEVKDEASFIAFAKSLNTEADYDADAKTLLKAYLKDSTSGENNLTSINQDLATWAFDDARKAGEVTLVEDSSEDSTTYYVALMVNPKHDIQTVSVRHILFKTVDDSNNPLDDATIKEKKAAAEETLEEYKSGEMTEDKFAEYATNLTEDTGSKSTGGLYEHVRPGQMVTEFDSWIFADGRKKGDVDIVETTYGYHVMYYVGNDGSYKDNTIKESLASEKFDEYSKELLEGDEYQIAFGPRRLKEANEQIDKKIAELVRTEKANSSSSSSVSY